LALCHIIELGSDSLAYETKKNQEKCERRQKNGMLFYMAV
jgi:hypothetical protein